MRKPILSSLIVCLILLGGKSYNKMKTIQINLNYDSIQNRLCISLHNNTNSKIYLFNHRNLMLRLSATGSNDSKNYSDITDNFIQSSLNYTNKILYVGPFKTCDHLVKLHYLTKDQVELFSKEVKYDENTRTKVNSKDWLQMLNSYIKGTIDYIIFLEPDSNYTETFYISPDSLKFESIKIKYDGKYRSCFIDRENFFKIDELNLSFPEEIMGYKRYDGDFITNSIIFWKKRTK